MISVGQKLLTDFKLRVVVAGNVKEVSFNELLMRPTIVSVYMRNNTGSCDKQVDSLVAHAPGLEAAGYQVIAISRDTAGSHLKYAAKKKISFVLASDPTDLFARAVDAIVEKSMYGRMFRGPARSAFVFDRDGTVLAVVAKVEAASHGKQLQAVIAALG